MASYRYLAGGLGVLVQDIVFRPHQMLSAPPGRGRRAAPPSHLAADRDGPTVVSVPDRGGLCMSPC